MNSKFNSIADYVRSTEYKKIAILTCARRMLLIPCKELARGKVIRSSIPQYELGYIVAKEDFIQEYAQFIAEQFKFNFNVFYNELTKEANKMDYSEEYLYRNAIIAFSNIVNTMSKKN